MRNKTSFTARSWEVIKPSYSGQDHYIACGDYTVATVHGYPGFGVDGVDASEEANANLIAKAPRLYEALKKLRDISDMHGEIASWHVAWNEVEKLLNEIEGES